MKSRPILVSADSRSRVVLPGRPDEQFILEELEDGAILLQPAAVISKAQLEYLTTPELRSLLEDAAASRTVKRGKRKRRSE